MREQLDYLTKKLFGTKSEKTSVLTGQIVLEALEELGQFGEAEVEADPEKEEFVITKKKTRKGYQRERVLINLPEEERVHTLAEEDKICKNDGDNLHYAGKNTCVAKLNIPLQL